MKQANGHAAANLEALKVIEKLEALTASATKLPLTNRAVLNRPTSPSYATPSRRRCRRGSPRRSRSYGSKTRS